jgi:type VI secretion system secreted protein Hcp
MDIVRFSLIAALVSPGVPTALVAQEKLVARGGAGFSMTIQGQQQGMFPGGGKEGAIAGFRFSYILKSPRDPASGLPTGKRMHTPVVFTKVVGIASPQLFSALAHNENLPSVVVTVPGYTIKLINANLSEIKQYTEVVNGIATVLEDVSFTFEKIEVRDPGTGATALDNWASPSE